MQREQRMQEMDQEKRWAFGPGDPLRASPNLLLPHGPLLSFSAAPTHLFH